MGQVKFLQKIPAPNSYKEKDVRDKRAPTMRSRHPDHDFEKSIKVYLSSSRILAQEPTNMKIWVAKATT